MTTPTTCTVRLAVDGLCGKPAVYTFTSSQGMVYSECAEHYGGPVAPEAVPAVTTRSVTLTHPVTGNKVRTVSGQRFIVVADFTGSKAVVKLRTGSLIRARQCASSYRSAVVFDRFTGSVVA